MSQEAEKKKIKEAAPEPPSVKPVKPSPEQAAPGPDPGPALPAPPDPAGVVTPIVAPIVTPVVAPVVAPIVTPIVASIAPIPVGELEYMIQPNTIIELVDLYVPPGQSEFRLPSSAFPQPQLELGPSTSSAAGAPTIRGRRRGRPPLGSRPTGIPPRKPYRRRRKAESPPPLPPVPNYLAHVINPLENEIYPKVIVQPARLPWVIPKNLNEDRPPLPPPLVIPPPPLPQQQLTERTLGPLTGTTMSPAQLCQSLKLFGPDVTVTQVTSHGQSRFLAVLKEKNGQQRHLLFSANQLQSFLCSRPITQVGPPPLSWQKPPPPGIVRLRPGPTPRRPNPASAQSLMPPPPPPPPIRPPRVILEPPPNFRLPTMAALRASAQQQARLQSAGTSAQGSRVVARTMAGPLPPGVQAKGVAGGVPKGVAGRYTAGVAAGGTAGKVPGGAAGGVAGAGPGRVIARVTGAVTGRAHGGFNGGAPGGFNGGVPSGFNGGGVPGGFNGVPGGFNGGGVPGGFNGGVPGGFNGGVPGGFNGGVPGGFNGGVSGGFNGGGVPGGFAGRVAGRVTSASGILDGPSTSAQAAAAMAKAKADQEKAAAAAAKEPFKPPRPRSPEMPMPRMPAILTRRSQMRLLHQRAKRAAEREAEEAKRMKKEPKDEKENPLLKF